MNYSQLEDFLTRYLRIQNDVLATPMIIGDSGIGKTQIVQQNAEKNGYSILEIDIGITTLERFMGLPESVKVNFNGKEEFATIWSIPDYVARANELNNKTVVFIDDVHLASDETQKVLYETLTKHTMHGAKFKPGTKIIMASNPRTSSYGATVMRWPKPIRSRMVEINLQPDFRHWLKVSAENKIHPIILSFLNMMIDSGKKSMFLDTEDNDNQHPCPRSWWNLSGYLNNGFPMTEELISGCVGKKAAVELLSYYKIYLKFEEKLPQSWKSLKDFREKSAFLSYLMIKNDPKIVAKYAKDINKEDKNQVFTLLFWDWLSDHDNIEMTKILTTIENKDFKKYILNA